ncbi:hypothetical protein [Nitratireductor sp. GCM10026969]|uniref:hypothetical protein n=1 Tax=Nitratireductor sp. GCM10026969 TaxID=3252645 RepID=UPI0036183C78
MVVTTADKVVVELEAKNAEYDRRMQRSAQITERGFGRIRQNAQRMQTSVVNSFRNSAASIALVHGPLGGVASRFSAAATLMDRGGVAAGALAVGLGGVALAARKAMTEISKASELAKAADRVGLTTTAFQELQFGMELAGVSATEFESNMERFTRRMGDAATKGGRLADIMEANGIAIRSADGRIRSSEALLREYAELIKNAATEQEAMTLATEAFGRSGGKMVLALRNGAAGLDDMADAAANAGGVIDEELLRRAEELDDEFAALWRTFEINAKSAILAASAYLRDMGSEIGAITDALNDLISNPSLRNASRALFGEGATNFALGMDADARIRQAHGGGDPQRDARLERQLRERYGVDQQTTVVPIKDDEKRAGSRNRAAAAAIREAEAVRDLIADLEFERSLIGLTDVEREKANNLRRAGAAATDEQREKIAALTEAIHNENAAIQAQEEAYEQLQQIGVDALESIVSAFEDGKLEAEELIGILIRVAQQLLQLKSLSGGGGGLLGQILGAIVPGFANGTSSAPGGLAIVGERGPELVNLPRGSQVVPNHRMPMGGTSVTINAPINAPGADAAQLARVEQSVKELARNVPKMVDKRTDTRNTRNTRP